ncbi:TonB-dependent receptor [Novimethylophilus kurashikiensis]|uniref:TonB-dependent receptor n=1 Tax=Novimethylophilus kurashikiensis TaxID=1825523 RepID=A0A2R5FCM5_9PROT|nr:TonB-dependent receptor [Novimethylophilus kurashikiensis]GBG15946.1 TonB-dependent receptor [Novimethylophilus kurashikiensis]
MHQVRVKTLVLAVAGAICMIQNVHAANQAEVLETGAVDVVSTTPLPSIGTPINEVPANVQTASAKSIAEQRNLDVSEFLDNNLGSVSTSNSVANPYQPDVAFRGFTASPLLGTPQGLSVFMDGVRVNEPFGDVVNWDLLPPNAIASINLVPGSNPVFGLNTLGGALSVNTKSGSEFPGTSVTAYGGSWGRRALEVETGGANADKSIDYFISGNTFKEDGWRDHSKSEVNQLFGKVGWQDEKSDLDLSVMFADTDMEGTQALPRSMLNNRHQAYTYPDSIGNNLAMVNLKGSHFFTDDILVAGNVYYRHNRITGFNSNAETLAPGDSANISTSTDQDGFGGALQMTLLKDLVGHKNQFTVGASLDAGRTDFTSDTAQASVIGNKTVNDPGVDEIAWVRLNARNDYYGVYATDTFSITDQLHATLSGRYNLAKIHLSGESFDDNLTPKTSDLSGNHRYSRFNPAIGLNYNPSQSLGFYGSYNEGMRAPTPVELSCADESRPCALPNAFAADPHLDMIVSKTWEGGVRGKLIPGLGWNASIYRTVNNNDIQFIASNATSTGFFKNVGDTKRQGVELGLNGKVERFSFAANYGFVDATYQSDFVVGSPSNSTADGAGKIPVTKGDKIPGIPRQTLKLRVGYEVTSNWSVGSNVVMAAGQYARGDENNKDINGKVPGYTVVNLDTHYAINDSWKVFAKINNVFDRDYETFGVLGTNIFNGQDEQFRSPAAPRAGWVGVTYEFGRPKGSAGARIDND